MHRVFGNGHPEKRILVTKGGRKAALVVVRPPAQMSSALGISQTINVSERGGSERVEEKKEAPSDTSFLFSGLARPHDSG